jgi:hypothetical protein
MICVQTKRQRTCKLDGSVLSNCCTIKGSQKGVVFERKLIGENWL